MNAFQRYLRRILYLENDIDRAAAALTIKKNIYFRGPNVRSEEHTSELQSRE